MTEYVCDTCDYTTTRAYNYDQHLKSNIHTKRTLIDPSAYVSVNTGSAPNTIVNINVNINADANTGRNIVNHVSTDDDKLHIGSIENNNSSGNLMNSIKKPFQTAQLFVCKYCGNEFANKYHKNRHYSSCRKKQDFDYTQIINQLTEELRKEREHTMKLQDDLQKEQQKNKEQECKLQEAERLNKELSHRYMEIMAKLVSGESANKK